MGKRPHKSFANEDKDKRIKAQREKIKELEQDIRRLKRQLKTLDDAFRKSAEYMSDESGPISVEKLIKDANSHKALKDSKQGTVPVDERELVRKKWDEWNRNRKQNNDDET